MDNDATDTGTPLEKLGRQFGVDARREARRSLLFAVPALLVGLAGPVMGCIALWHHRVGSRGVAAIAALYLAASVPIWWQSNCYRRSAGECRRLERHAQLLEPYLAGFDRDTARIIRATLGQRLFARTIEDNDILRDAIWPTPDQLRTSVPNLVDAANSSPLIAQKPSLDEDLGMEETFTTAQLRQLLKKYESELRAGGLEENTIRTYLDHPERFLRWVEGTYSPTKK